MNTPLKNPRHELFAQALVHGMSADAAYTEAGYKADRGNAARMTANDSICDRVAELQAAAKLEKQSKYIKRRGPREAGARRVARRKQQARNRGTKIDRARDRRSLRRGIPRQTSPCVGAVAHQRSC